VVERWRRLQHAISKDGHYHARDGRHPRDHAAADTEITRSGNPIA
jgi:hypothetical protein